MNNSYTYYVYNLYFLEFESIFNRTIQLYVADIIIYVADVVADNSCNCQLM